MTKDRKRLDPDRFLNTLYKDGWKIIYHRRRNKVKHTLSAFFAKNRASVYQSDIWHKFNDDREELNIFVDCERFKRKIEKITYFDDYEKKVLADIEYHEVIYEDDLEQPQSHQKTVDRILDYLSLEPRKTSTNLRKVNTLSPKELISNYEEFVECSRKSGWSKFLE